MTGKHGIKVALEHRAVLSYKVFGRAGPRRQPYLVRVRVRARARAKVRVRVRVRVRVGVGVRAGANIRVRVSACLCGWRRYRSKAGGPPGSGLGFRVRV